MSGKEHSMVIDPVVLSSITAAVTALATDYAKGLGGEAAKSTWTAIKSLFGWTSDPAPVEIPEKVASALTVSPDVAPKVVDLLKSSQSGTASALVGNLVVSVGGKVVIAQSIQNLTM
jgi:hypothetical protein